MPEMCAAGQSTECRAQNFPVNARDKQRKSCSFSSSWTLLPQARPTSGQHRALEVFSSHLGHPQPCLVLCLTPPRRKRRKLHNTEFPFSFSHFPAVQQFPGSSQSVQMLWGRVSAEGIALWRALLRAPGLAWMRISCSCP